MCSEGVCNPVTGRFLSLSPLFRSALLRPQPPHPACSLSSIRNDGATPLFSSPIALPCYITPVSKHPPCLSNRMFPRRVRLPVLACSKHTCAHTHSKVRRPTVIIRQCWPLSSVSVKAHTEHPHTLLNCCTCICMDYVKIIHTNTRACKNTAWTSCLSVQYQQSLNSLSLCLSHRRTHTHTHTKQRLTAVKWSCQLAGAPLTNKHPIFPSKFLF